MMCTVCGGKIAKGESCDRCGISYDDMIDAIRHDEMIGIFNRIEELDSWHRSIAIEVSLLACELWNSHLLIPAEIRNSSLFLPSVYNFRGKSFVMLFTDREEYDKGNFDVEPLTNPFGEYLKLLDEGYEGFIINVNNHACELSKKFFNLFFEVGE